VRHALRMTLGNQALTRAQLSFGAAFAAEWAFTVALGLVAYADGGATAVGLVGVLRLLPAAVLAPLIGAYADRRPREQVLIASSVLRAAATLAAAAVLAAGGTAWIVYGLAVVSTIGFTPFRATHSALLPLLCRTAEELTVSNVVRGLFDSLSIAIGPLVAAVLVSAFDLWTVFAFAGLAALAGAILLLGLRYEHIERAPAAEPRLVRDMVDGLRAIRATRDLALILALPSAQAATRGALSVFVVVVAIELVDIGEPGVGWLQGAMGVGALAGSFAATRLVRSQALARWLAAGVALWAVPLALIGLVPNVVVALLALLVIGAANSLIDASGFSLPGRMVPDEMIARVFAVLESGVAFAVAAGALLTPLAISLLGTRGALVLVGVIGPAICVLVWPRVDRVDRELSARAEDIQVLRGVPMMRVLPVGVIEHLARHLERVELPADATVFSAGDAGDRFYVVGSGRVRVMDGDRLVRVLGPGEGFGEIALLRDVPRTMTVTVEEAAVLHAVSRSQFLTAITGFRSASAEADALAEQRLAAAPGALSAPR
jgi:MFS family permease